MASAVLDSDDLSTIEFKKEGCHHSAERSTDAAVNVPGIACLGLPLFMCMSVAL